MIPEKLETFSRYWKEAEPMLRIYLEHAIYNREDSRDVLQRTALCAFKKFDDFKETLSFKAWTLGIARFEVLAYLRDHGRRREVVDSEIAENIRADIQDTSEELMQEQNGKRMFLMNMLEQLPDKARHIIKLRFFEEKSYEDIGQELNMSPGTVRTAVSRLVAKMRGIVKDYEREGTWA